MRHSPETIVSVVFAKLEKIENPKTIDQAVLLYVVMKELKMVI